jgi:hypothetical protein
MTGFAVSGLVQFGLVVSPDARSKVTAEQLDAWSIANTSLSVATTVMATLIIIIHILRVTRLPGAQLSSSAVEIVVESAALYAVSSLVFLGLAVPTSTTTDVRFFYAQVFFSTMAVCCTLLFFHHSLTLRQAASPALIMLRVVLGRARPNTEWATSRKMSTLRFEANSGPRSTLHEHTDAFNNSRAIGSSSDESQTIDIGLKNKEVV